MATAPALPDKIGPYRITRRLGQGGMGIVFEGIHEEIERRVAIKLLKSEFARDHEVARRFFNESRCKKTPSEKPGLTSPGNDRGSVPDVLRLAHAVLHTQLSRSGRS